jgi:hypothetical protein
LLVSKQYFFEVMLNDCVKMDYGVISNLVNAIL